MVSDRLRLAATSVLWCACGVLGAIAADSSRTWAAAALLGSLGVIMGWPLARAHRRTDATTPEPRFEPRPATLDEHTLAALYLERLPIALWLIKGEQEPQVVTSRARRLVANGGVRDTHQFTQMLRSRASRDAITLDTERGPERWQIHRQSLAIEGEQQWLVALTPIENELESESMQARQQLVQILTHEIMNSLTPIKSLSETALDLLDDADATLDLRTALDAIGRRTTHIAAFVDSYRQIAQWPAPVMTPVDLGALFARLRAAIEARWRARNGTVSFEIASPGARLMADEGQLEQALLALISNAENATAAQAEPQLAIQAKLGRGGRMLISVRDNGAGVPEGLEQQIFLPFFTTRENGQGIGLAVVRQLIHGMGGRVRYVRSLQPGATFLLMF
ncbi:HAMP domain-containing sensor histidine kinase [Povalibacter sp.]|uniref:sensor histidine kinase n=1 Tax=Povalibacter sp. TaxID=1962978 RepID=UPI002F418460